MSLRIRRYRDADLEFVNGLRLQAIRTTTALWVDEDESVAGTALWVAGHAGTGAVLVAEEVADAPTTAAGRRTEGGCRPVGFGALGPWNGKSGYRHTAEDSVYVAPADRGRGVGHALLEGLLAEAPGLGLHVVIAAVEAGNRASIALHLSAGFTEVGTAHAVGRKFGRWLDLTILELVVGEGSGAEGS